MPTMVDVANRAGVSLSTVSYALNGTRPISEETRQRVFAAMEELGYKPHALARGLASKRSRIIALLFPAAERGLGLTELEFVTSAADAATERGYHLVLWSSEMRDADELRRLIQQGLVDGVVVMEVHLHDARVNLLREIQFPFSIIGRCADTGDFGYIDIDFDQAVRDAVTYLAELGHTQIAFLNQSQTVFDAGYGPAVRTHASFEQAVASAHLTGVARCCPATPQGGVAAFDELLAVCPDLSALVTINERAIPGVMQAVAARGWRVPADISLVSIATSARLAEMTTPPLTTMEPPSAQLGRQGVELLIRQLELAQHEAPQMLLPCRLIVRGSSAPRCVSRPHETEPARV